MKKFKVGSRLTLLFMQVFALQYISQSAVSAADHKVSVVTDPETGEVGFFPKRLIIEVGDRVIWRNREDNVHNMVTYPDGIPAGAQGFASPLLFEAGEEWSYEFTVSGTFQYHCIPHIFMNMEGEIIVERATPHGQKHKPSQGDIDAYEDRLMEFFSKDEIAYFPDRIKNLFVAEE